jgi:hypothetical protein
VELQVGLARMDFGLEIGEVSQQREVTGVTSARTMRQLQLALKYQF